MNILLLSLLGCLGLALPLVSGQKVKFCLTTASDLALCKRVSAAVPEIECLQQTSTLECIKSIKQGDADVVTADGEHIYQGGLVNYDLRPLVIKSYKKGCCHAVAVVKKDSAFTIKDLSQKTSCHSCYRSSGGWKLPIGRMISEGIIPWGGIDEKPLDKAVVSFFSSSCVPGISKATYPSLCQACKGDCSCSRDSEPYFGEAGAFQCLKDGAGQVAFVCHSAIPVDERPSYQLLCMDGTRKSVDEYESCSFGKEPEKAIIGRKDADSSYILQLLEKIPKDIYPNEVEMKELSKSTDSFFYLKEDYFWSMQALKGVKIPTPSSDDKIKWCTVGHKEQKKCDDLLSSYMECQSALTVEDCIKMVKRREADAFAADGGQVYTAGKCGLVPAMVEQYDTKSCGGGDEASYYVVAVVRKGSGVTWSSLKGKKSCHTGVGRNAGWKVPDSAICGDKPDCDLYKFFSEGCAPGADPSSNMCKLCKGNGRTVGNDEKCKASAGEIYYGYDGAFRCLAEKAGEVAFIKHTVVGDYTDGKGPSWASNQRSDEFELICPEFPDGTKKVTEFSTCNLAKVPAHAVITRPDAHKRVVSVLKDVQQKVKDLFKSEEERNLLFTDTTKCLQETTKPIDEFLTDKYIKMIEKTQGKSDLVQACTLKNCLSHS